MKKTVLFALIMVCGLSATGLLIALTVLPSVAEASPVYLVVHAVHDIDRVWVLSDVTGSLTRVQLSGDLFEMTRGRTEYNATMLLDLVPTGGTQHHYCFEYEQRGVYASKLETLQTEGFTVCHNYSSDTINSFYPGALRFSSVTGSGKWALLRETMFIFGRDNNPRDRWEQIYRGPDGQLYVFRVLFGAQLFKLTDLIAQGYSAYNLSALAIAPEICGKITLSPLQPAPIQKRLYPLR